MGHAFFVRIYGGEIKGLGFGEGEVLIKVKKFFVKRKLILMGRIEWKLPINLTSYKYILIYLGGIIFNIITGTLVWIFGNVEYADYYRNFIIFSYLVSFCSLVPFKYSPNTDSDGLKVLNIFIDKRSKLNDR